MRRIALVITFAAGLIASAFAEKAEIEAVNAKWIEFFNKGDFARSAPDPKRTKAGLKFRSAVVSRWPADAPVPACDILRRA